MLIGFLEIEYKKITLSIYGKIILKGSIIKGK